MKKNIKNTIFLGGILLLSSCGGSSDAGSVEKTLQQKLQEAATKEIKVDSATVKLLENIHDLVPPPIVMAHLIHASNAPYSPEFLNSVENVEKYNTGFKQGVNLGIYGADLGYINLYEKPQTSISYLKVVAQLAEGLNVAQFFKVKEMLEYKDDFDKLISVSQASFLEIDAFLKNKGQGDISAAMLIGGWLEMLYLMTKTAEISEESKQILFEKIGEQKVVIDEIIKLAEAYDESPHYADLISGLNGVKSAYDGVEITYQKVAAAPLPELDGLPMMNVGEEVEEQIINVTEEDIVVIAQKINELRNKLIL